MSALKKVSPILVVLAFGAASGDAGVYSDDLSRCLVDSTTEEDRVDLVKWMFAAASAHPAVQPLTSVSAEQLESANKKMADLVMRLLTETCRESAQKATQYEGAATLQTSFQTLGQVAGQELFASPEVSEAMSGLERHLDEERLEFLAGSD